jgi:hypothetical protein
MRGKPGAGKSTIMKFIYLETKRNNGPETTTVSFFFNSRGNDLEKSTMGMYRSLLIQLFREFRDLQSILDNPEIIPQDQQDCPNLDTLKELFQSAVMALNRRSFICFIDALDECDEQEVRDMVQFFEDLAEHATESNIQFRIWLASRPYPYISLRKGISLNLEDESGHAEDLEQYIKSNLTIDDPLIRADLQSQLLSKAAGIFMWVVLVVDILKKENDEGGLTLRKKLSEIPTKLSDLFKNMLRRDKKTPERLLHCILWIICAKRPLSPIEFYHALWITLLDQNSEDLQAEIELPDVKTIHACAKLVTNSSKGLAEVSKSEQPIVQFIHESVRDFLVSKRGIEELWPELGFEWETRIHERLKRYCNTYISVPGIQAYLHGSKDEDKRDALVKKYSFLEYASQQVLYHANVAALTIPQNDFLSRFLTSPGIRTISLFRKHGVRKYCDNTTPLYILADEGLGNLIRIQTKKEPATYVAGEVYEYPFFAALHKGHKDAVAALLGLSSFISEGVNITEGFRYRRSPEAHHGRTPLTWAVEEASLTFMKFLIHHGMCINEHDRLGGTPLLLASMYGYQAKVQFLLENGADVNIQDNHGPTALIWTSCKGYEAIARLLIKKGAGINIRDNNGWTALTWALLNRHEALARLLIENEAEINAQDNNGWTALIWASFVGFPAYSKASYPERG